MGWLGDNLRATAIDLDLHAAVDDDTFSQDPAAGTSDAAHPLVRLFRVPAVDGGELAWSDYAGRPTLILIGSAPGIRAMLRRVQPVVGHLITVGLLVAYPPDGWKGTLLDPKDAAALTEDLSNAAGRFDVPVGIDIKGAVATSLAPAWSRVSNLTALVLVGADGAVALATDDRVTDDELRTAAGHLEEAGTP
jgi:hypothetical protein